MTGDLVAEALVGFRAWKINKNLLRPVWQGTGTWDKPGNVEAGCFVPRGGFMYGVPLVPEKLGEPEERRNHSAPGLDCGCGLHAYYSVALAQNEGADCVGAIVAWGRIVECERGFKAQYAKPIALLEPDDEDDRFATISERYELPVLPLDELVQYTHMFGEVRDD